VISELAQEIFIVNQNTIHSALKIHKSYQYSYYDSLIIASALERDCNYLFSEDMNGGQIIDNKLKTINPFDLR
jgi:predicted nucleic acid-binding protein